MRYPTSCEHSSVNTGSPQGIFVVRIGYGSGLVFALIGTVSVVVGGLIAAVSRPLDWSYGSWVSAYLVLVTGVAQFVLGVGQDHLTERLTDHLSERPLRRRTIWTEIAGLNIGSAAVISGTLMSRPWIVDVGGLLIFIALVQALLAVRGVPSGVLAVLYRLIIGIVIVSIPVGLVLAHLGAR